MTATHSAIPDTIREITAQPMSDGGWGVRLHARDGTSYQATGRTFEQALADAVELVRPSSIREALRRAVGPAEGRAIISTGERMPHGVTDPYYPITVSKAVRPGWVIFVHGSPNTYIEQIRLRSQEDQA